MVELHFYYGLLGLGLFILIVPANNSGCPTFFPFFPETMKKTIKKFQKEQGLNRKENKRDEITNP